MSRFSGRAAVRAALWALAAFALTSAAQSPAPPSSPPTAIGRPAASPAAPAASPAAHPRVAGGASTAAPASRPPARPIIPLDRVVAVVNDEALTQFDLNEQKRAVLQQMKTQKVTPPPADVLDKQLLERLITERALMQYAKETGVRIDDLQVERTIARVAQENKMSPEDFRKAVEREGIPYAKYREEIRNEIMVQRLRDREVDSKLNVSDAEVDNFLATVVAQTGGETEYRLSHVLVIVPEQSSPEQIAAKRRRAEEALKQIRSGTDFSQVAAGFSDAPDALKGGDLGWRAPARLPTVFAEPVRNMKPGDVSSILRSSTGFHIVKLEEIRSRNQPTVVEQTHARHILIKVNEITSESEGKIKIDRVKDRIDGGAKFEDQARLSSEDASASKGGDLGWISPGDTVPDFEQAMAKLKPNEISAAGAHPVRLAPDPGSGAPHAGHHRRAAARAGAPGDAPAQVRRGVSGVGA